MLAHRPRMSVKQAMSRACDAVRLFPLYLGNFRHMSSAYAGSFRGLPSMSDARQVKLFRNGRNQAVRIPMEFELPGTDAIMHREGDRLIIEPLRKRGLLALLKTMEPIPEELPEIDDPAPAPERLL